MGIKQEITLYQYWGVGKPIPDGWRLANDLQGNHHGYHAVLLVKDNESHQRKTQGRKVRSPA